jgi:hypothetical protein
MRFDHAASCLICSAILKFELVSCRCICP